MNQMFPYSSEYTPPDLGQSFNEATPSMTVNRLAHLLRKRESVRPLLFDEDSEERGEVPDQVELFDADGLWIGSLDYTFDEAWYCD